MSELISGKEALLALLNGEDVLIKSLHWDNFDDLTTDFTLNVFFMDEYEFKLKPRTITLNGIEVPACGKDYKHNTYMFVLNSLETSEYSKVILDESDEVPAYWWRTEEEIKQVVDALRSIFK